MKKLSISKKISPLAKRMVIYAVLASAFITIFTSIFQLYGIYKTDVNGIEVRMNEVRDSYSKNIASLLWVSNKNELDITLKGILRLPDIVYIDVYEDEELVAQQGQLPNSDFIANDFPLHYYFQNKLQQIGRVHITATLENIYNHLYEQAVTIIISNTIITFFIASFILFLFYTLVARHLIAISHFAEILDKNFFDNKLELKLKTSSEQFDEIDQLAHALIRLQKKLKESLEEAHENQVTLKNNEAKFRGVLESAFSGILMLNSKGIITLVNKSLCDLTGYSQDELVGSSIEKLVPVSFANHAKLREEYFKNPKKREMGAGNTFQARRKNGSHFDVEVSLSPVETESEVYVAAMMQDISVRVQNEREKEDLLKSLEYKNEELERFTYTVSHDLKSPLVTISGFIGFLKKDIAENNQKRIEDDFNRINDAANIMQKLLDDLLELSRIGRQVSARVDVSINDIVKNVLEMLSVKIESSKAKIIIEPDLPIIHVEESRFKEVYLNLIENAIKYRNKDSDIEIEIGVHQENNNSEQVFFVKDNGEGIDARYHSKVFGLFERLNNESEGTGVGLAIVKRIIEVHNGRVWVESEGPGKGATFNFVVSDGM